MTHRRRWGTARNPGSDLAQLPVGLDLAGISLAEGLRAALAAGVVLLLDLWLHQPPLLLIASGAMLTCFCDVGGTLRQRLPMLLSFAVLGGITWAAFGLLRAAGTGPALLVVAPAVFLFSMARVWGLRPQTVGNILLVVMALALDRPLDGAGAALVAACFIAGGLWASLLTAFIWRLRPDAPAREAVSRVLLALADLAGDLRLLIERQAPAAEWDAHARAHRRAVRGAIETGRGVVASAMAGRGLVSGGAAAAATTLEAADQLFGETIVLSELMEGATDPAAREAAIRLLRRVRPLLRVLALGRRAGRERLTVALDRAAPAEPALGALAGLMVDRLRVLVRVATGQDRETPRAFTAAPTETGPLMRVWAPLRDELVPGSAILRHALRATLLTVPAVAAALVWWTPYAHWLSITVALTMQPFFAATWQRALERIGGTALGALLGGALAFVPATPTALGVALVALSVIGFSVRQVSYGAYIACLTPLIVLLFEIAEPTHSPWLVAGMRALYTLVGGGIAVLACLTLWPSWEPDRLRTELRGTLLAYARLAGAVLATPATRRDPEVESARRAAGVANSNLEASLSRALQEPGRRHRAELVRVLAADAMLRRLGAMLLALPHDGHLRAELDGAALDGWRRYLEGALTALADGRASFPAPPDEPRAESTLHRLHRALDVLAGDLRATRDAGHSVGGIGR